MEKVFLSIVTPVYGAPKIIPVLYQRLVEELTPWADFEIIMVNDACPKGSGEEVKKLADKDERVKFVNLSRNFGQHAAISAGLDYANGDYVVVMDCDLQDPPEEIRKLYDTLVEGGHKAVFGVRKKRQDSLIKRARSKVFGIIYNYLSDDALKDVNGEVSNFSIVTRQVALAFRAFHEKRRSYSGIIMKIVPHVHLTDVKHSTRYEGKSSYSLTKLLDLAIGILIFNSSKPLFFSFYCGLGFFLLALILAARSVYHYFLFGPAVIGWTSIMVVICFFSGLQMLFLGIIGSYLNNIFTETKRRPLYVVDSTQNVDYVPRVD